MKRFCVDCGKELSGWKALRCQKHANYLITRKFVGKKLTEEHKKKMRDAWDYDKHITESWRKKQSEVNKGKPVTPIGSKWSEKQRQNIMTAREKWTPEFKAARAKRISVGQTGEKNHQWMSDRMKLKQRPTPEQKAWRKKVLERDNNTCQECGLKSDKLDCHHIYSYKEYPELRWVVSNGLALCHECHMKTEDYGVNKNTFRKRDKTGKFISNP